MIDLLSMLLDAYVLIGNFQHKSGLRYAAKQEVHDYLIFTKIRVCPASGDWPKLSDCLNSEYACRVAWLPHLRAGKSLTEAIRATILERNGNWSWTVPQVASQYASISKSRAVALNPADEQYEDDDQPPPPKPRRARSRSRKAVTWQDPPPSRSDAHPRQQGRGNGRTGGNSSRPGRGSGSSNPGSQNPVSRTGKAFCKDYNKGNCVDGQCPMGFVHACSHVDPTTGKLCGKLGHRKCHHGVHRS